MQTFLINSSFTECARVLDNKRLVKQLIEAKQILNTLIGKSSGWKNHPAVKMWDGCTFKLFLYIQSISDECKNRGFKHGYPKIDAVITFGIPKWAKNEAFYSSHRSRLLCKGKIDALCLSIKNFLKKKSINEWLIQQNLPIKNMLKHNHIDVLQKICFNNSIDVGPNWYEQWGWKEDTTQNYIWPI